MNASEILDVLFFVKNTQKYWLNYKVLHSSLIVFVQLNFQQYFLMYVIWKLHFFNILYLYGFKHITATVRDV